MKGFLLSLVVCLLTGCAYSSTLFPLATESAKPTEQMRYFITGKKLSSLSLDRKTLTLSLDLNPSASRDLKIEWAQDNPFGTFNSTRGSRVVWTATKEGTYQVNITATATGGNPEVRDIASFSLSISEDKIQPSELAPELMVAPQSLTLFKALPTSLATSQQWATFGVRTQAQLTATSYIFDPITNTKVKRTGGYDETVWSSSDPEIVTVSDNGYVQATEGSSVGEVTVMATSKTNSQSFASAKVKVQYLDTNIELRYNTTTLFLQGWGAPNSIDLKAIVKYSNPKDRNRIIFTDENGKEISWSSSNPSMVQVDSAGRCRVLNDAKEGDVVISARSNYDPSVSISVTLHVVKTIQTSVLAEVFDKIYINLCIDYRFNKPDIWDPWNLNGHIDTKNVIIKVGSFVHFRELYNGYGPRYLYVYLFKAGESKVWWCATAPWNKRFDEPGVYVCTISGSSDPGNTDALGMITVL